MKQKLTAQANRRQPQVITTCEFLKRGLRRAVGDPTKASGFWIYCGSELHRTQFGAGEFSLNDLAWD